MALTTKQGQLMSAIVRANPDGSFLDTDQLVMALPYETTKQSLHFSTRSLIKKGLIEKKGTEVRRGRSRQVIAPTVSGMALMKP
ncbi:MAG: hypothetical protein HRT93_03140 [Piscirickettsiaceae bacterium]|nr:hypothetical protein [Piscirickettsiaceae bacterium]